MKRPPPIRVKHSSISARPRLHLQPELLPPEFQRYAGLIIRHCINFYPSFRAKRKMEEVQDLYSIVAAQLWKKRIVIKEQYDSARPFREYLLTIVGNGLRKELARRGKSVAAVHFDGTRWKRMAENTPAASDRGGGYTRYTRYLNAKSRLSKTDRTILSLYETNGSKLQTYLLMRGINPSTLTKKELARAKRETLSFFQSLSQRLGKRMNQG